MAQLQATFYQALGERMRNARLAANVSQGKLAKSVGLSRSSVANIETGRQPIYVDALIRVAEQLRIPILKLIPPGSEEMRQANNKELNRLADDKRHWVIRVLHTPGQKKEKNGGEILFGKKTSGRIVKTSARHKSAGPHRETSDTA